MLGVITLAVHLGWCAIWRSWIARVLEMTLLVLLELLDSATGSLLLILTWNLGTRLVTDRRELDRSATLRVARGRAAFWDRLTLGRDSDSASTILVGLALVLLLLLASLPLFANLFEFCSTTDG
jgi:hypothetical protein